ncbi:MAG: ATP-dependent protease ATPase subunit HslU [Treponema sp.]|nr:ATP-dependent protease ATPase subunit HslU [Treponema sp.]
MENLNEKQSINVDNIVDLTPKQIVEKLDTYIIGQAKAKRCVAVALRNRTRRLRLNEDIQEEIAPKNILMIGPTGVGKTEIARRLAKLCNAPFLKVEATKYTEVGYVGRDVESMVRDLMAVGYNDVKKEMQEQLKEKCGPKVEEDLLDLLLPGSSKKNEKPSMPMLRISNDFMNDSNESTAKTESTDENASSASAQESTREKFRSMLREGKLEDREVEVSVERSNRIPSMQIIAGGNMEDLENGMQDLASLLTGNKPHKKHVTVREARQILLEKNLEKMTDPDKVADIAKKRVEQMGIIFIDEIDKIAVRGGQSSGNDVSREGVQRDILPIVEGSNVNTRYGVVDTTHILFIAAGAFSVSAPSDLIPELQGRFPLRVQLDSLNSSDFRRILTEPKNALMKQYKSLLGTEGVKLEFEDAAIDRISELAEAVNKKAENIGARRLQTIMESVLEDISFSADEHNGETITITKSFVDDKLKDVIEDQDISRYIL